VVGNNVGNRTLGGPRKTRDNEIKLKFGEMFSLDVNWVGWSRDSVAGNLCIVSLSPPPPRAPPPSVGLGLPHKIRLNFLEASQQFSFLQGKVVSPMPSPHPGGPDLCIYIPQRQGGAVIPPGTGYPF
jgi:hypothetical protein